MREHDPAITPPGDPPQCCILVTAKPNGDLAIRRQWIDAGVLDRVPLTLEGDVRFGPQLEHQLHLLLGPLAAIAEVFIQAYVFDGVPTNTDAEAEPAARENIE